ncbi:MAG: AAA family ATPase, partial [Spirochaetes bacterium]|nr:AAA family ATPase [Spirochaetota bacterium]
MMELSQIKGEEEVVGTFGYMSPEATGIVKKAIDERSDLYSLGIVFYNLLTGELPFKAKDTGALLHQQVAVEAELPSKLKSSIPKILEEIVLKLLYKDPELRYQSSRGLLHDIQRYLKGEKEFIIGQQDQKVKLTYQTRLVGREEEVSMIKDLFDKVKKNEGNICLIGGEPGVGKTRLVESIQEYAYEQGYEEGGMFIRGRCLNQENKIPYQPFRDALNEYIKKIEKMNNKGREKEKGRLNKILGEMGDIIIRLNSNMSAILGEVPDLIPLEPEKENQRFIMVVSDFFTRIADKGQVCIIFLDDLQWADEGTLRLLEEIASKINKTNLFIIGTYRDNEVDEAHSLYLIKTHTNHPIHDIKLKQLDHKKLNTMIAGLLGEQADKAVKLTDFVLEKSNGNPFFAITLLREMVEQKLIVWEVGSWKEDWNKIGNMKVPINIIDMVLLKIKDIPDEVDHLLRLGSVIGKEFEMGLLYDLLDKDEETVVNLVDKAIDSQLLEYSILRKGKVIFIHDRIKEAFFARMGEKEKKENHLKIAKAIRERFKGKEDEVVFDLAHHYIEGGDKENGLTFGLQAADKAKANYANIEAMKYYTYVKKILIKKKDRSETYIRVLEGLGDVQRLDGKYHDALENFKTVLSIVKDRMHKARVSQKIGFTLFGMGRGTEAIKISEDTLKLLKFNRTPRSLIMVLILFTIETTVQMFHLIFPKLFVNSKYAYDERRKIGARIYLRLGFCYYHINMFKTGLALIRSVNLGDKMAGTYEHGFTYLIQCTLWIALAGFPIAEKYAKGGLKLAQKSDNKLLIGLSHVYLSFLSFAMNKIDKTIDYGRIAIDMLVPMGERWDMAVAFCFTWRGLFLKGDLKAGVLHTERYFSVMRNINEPRTVGWSTDHYARALTFSQGPNDEIVKMFKTALAKEEETKESGNIIMIYASFPLVYTLTGKFKEAIEGGETGIKIFHKSPAKGNWLLDIFGYTADAYLTQIEEEKLDAVTIKKNLKRAKVLCREGLLRSRIFRAYFALHLRITSKYNWLKGKKGKAIRLFNKGIRYTRKRGYQFELALNFYELGKFLYKEGYSKYYSKEKGKEYLLKAKELLEKIGSKPYLIRTIKLLGEEVKAESGDDTAVTQQDRLQLERRMTTVLNTSRYLSSILDLDELLEKIMDRTIELVGAERGLLLLYPDKDEGKPMELETKVLRGVKS